MRKLMLNYGIFRVLLNMRKDLSRAVTHKQDSQLG